jgi:predicted dehydrogenase
VAGRDADRAAAYAIGRGIDTSYGSYDALLADPDLDAVYVSVPNALHLRWAVAAIEAGKHVLCEKPLSIDPAEVERAYALAAEHDVILVEGLMWRHNPQTERLLELIRSGAIGETRLVRATFSFPLSGAEDFRFDPELGGGALADVGSYCASGVRLFACEPESVSAQSIVRGGVDIRLVAALRHPGGILSTIDCGMDLPDRAGLEIVGSEGILRVSDAWDCQAVGIERIMPDGTTESIPVPLEDSFRLELENFAAAAAGREAPLIGPEDTIAQARLLGAIAASAERRGTAVTP